MINGFEIVNDKDKIPMELLLLADPSLPQVVKNLNTCHAFAGLYDAKPVAALLMAKKESCYDIVNLAVSTMYQNRGFGREMLLHALDFARVNGGRYVEIGCGNAQVHLFVLFQKAGFRVVGVWPDHYRDDVKQMSVENAIINRDMLRMRVDLNDQDRLKITTLG